MKRTIFILILLISVSTFAQQRRVKNIPNFDRKWLHFGFTVGLNMFDASVALSDAFLQQKGNGEYTTIDQVFGIENTPSPGFHLGPIVNLRINEFADLRALVDLSFGSRKLVYTLKDTTGYLEEPYYNHEMNIESIFLEVPVQFKYKAKRINNYRPYVIFGATTKWDMAAQKKIKDQDKPKIRFKSFDVYWEAGVGVDFYLPYFKFSTEVKYQVGIFDIVNRDATQYTSAIDKMTSRMLVVSFHFE